MAPQSFILQLPVELCEKVVMDAELSLHDIRSLRLTCKSLAAIARPFLLYGQVVLSRVKEDRDKFEKFVKDHRLHVREVIWQGLDLEAWINCPIWLGKLSQCNPIRVVPSVLRDPDLLWIPLRIGQVGPPDEIIYLEAADWISKQIESTPNITTLTIKPMPGIRASGNILNTEVINTEIMCFPHYMTGEYDITVALDALRRLGCRVRTLNLNTSLRRIDIWKLPFKDTQVFQHLTAINICSGRVNSASGAKNSLLYCLRHANMKSLESLKLCFSVFRSPTYTDCTDDFLRILFGSRSHPLTRLHSLHIIRAECCNSVVPFTSGPGLPGLRHLTLDDCGITSSVLWYMGRYQKCHNLQSITIRAQNRPFRRTSPLHKQLVSEARILAFLRNEVDLSSGPNKTMQIVTDNTAPLCESCLTAPDLEE